MTQAEYGRPTVEELSAGHRWHEDIQDNDIRTPLGSDGQGFDAFIVDAPRFANTFEVFNDGDILLATFPDEPLPE